MNETNPTPLPWEVHFRIPGNGADIRGPTGQEVALRIFAPNAALIVSAVNAHDELLAVCKLAYSQDHNRPYPTELIGKLRIAIEKAEGRDTRSPVDMAMDMVRSQKIDKCET